LKFHQDSFKKHVKTKTGWGRWIEVIPNLTELFLLGGLRKQAMLLDLLIFSSSWVNYLLISWMYFSLVCCSVIVTIVFSRIKNMAPTAVQTSTQICRDFSHCPASTMICQI
jgi:hypothetical protein